MLENLYSGKHAVFLQKQKIVIIYESFVFMIKIDPIPLQFGLASLVRVLGLSLVTEISPGGERPKIGVEKLEVDIHIKCICSKLYKFCHKASNGMFPSWKIIAVC